MVAISKSMVGVSLIEKVAFEQRLKRGEREPRRPQGGPGERTARAAPSGRSGLVVIRRRSKVTTWLEWKE